MKRGRGGRHAEVMNSFLTALQFLTRINLRRQDAVTPEAFGASVVFFPLVGAVIGLILAAFWHFAAAFAPAHALAAAIVVLGMALTGGLHCDGLMDTMDGLFSGRSRERMLEIMKDSRVGANGVMAFAAFLLLKWAVVFDLLAASPGAALFFAPVAGRLAMVVGITCFPYARPEGMGKAFADHAGRPALYWAAATAAAAAAACGPAAMAALAGAVVFAALLGRYVTRMLGGLTGDVYGAMTELTELGVLATFLLLRPGWFIA